MVSLLMNYKLSNRPQTPTVIARNEMTRQSIKNITRCQRKLASRSQLSLGCEGKSGLPRVVRNDDKLAYKLIKTPNKIKGSAKILEKRQQQTNKACDLFLYCGKRLA